MKKYLYLLLCILSLQNATAQLNLVPNPSFEDTVYCPFGNNQLDACANWLNFGNSPDYFNACSNPAFGVPNSVFGFQFAHTGNAFAGAVFFLRPNHPAGPNYREFLGVELLNNLVIGQKYYVSFFAVNAGKYNVAIANNKLGVNFYTVAFDSCCPPPLLNTSKIFTDSILLDTLNWTKINGSFIADSAYRYLSISNFFDDANTDTTEMYPFYTHGYYYIDDVCVSTDSLYNETWTGLNEINESINQIIIYPNPSSGYYRIESPIPIDNFLVYNIHGQIINDVITKGSFSTTIDLSNQSRGIYIIKIQTKNKINNHKIILTY